MSDQEYKDRWEKPLVNPAVTEGELNEEGCGGDCDGCPCKRRLRDRPESDDLRTGGEDDDVPPKD